MTITMDLRDKHGKPLELGDTIELFSWGQDKESIGVGVLIWDKEEGRISTSPVIIEDAYDFYTKALPRCVKI